MCIYHPRLLALVQVMDLPADVWGKLSQFMDVTDWAMACGASRASYAARRQALAAEVRSKSWKSGRVNIRQLQPKKWSACHSMFLSLWRLHQTGKLTPAEIADIDRAARTLPLLRCLHIIGRSQVPLNQSSLEGVLLSVLARHALVLTLQVKTVTMPLDLPNLQHLVLDIGARSHKGPRQEEDGEAFQCISMLKGIITLYVKSPGTRILHPIDLTGCVHLQHLALQDVRLLGKLTLPEPCLLHDISTGKSIAPTSDYATMVSGWTAHTRLAWLRQRLMRLRPHKWGLMPVKWEWLAMHNLKHLQIIVEEGHSGKIADVELQLHITPSYMPCLEVLVVLNLQCSLSLDIHPEVPLRTLAVITAGSLQLHMETWSQLEAQVTALEQIYLQSSMDFLPLHIDLARRQSLLHQQRIRPLEYLREGTRCWTARSPPSFQPGNLWKCCCKACPECLARAGVSVLCNQAWTRDGFEKRLNSCCNKIPRYYKKKT